MLTRTLPPLSLLLLLTGSALRGSFKTTSEFGSGLQWIIETTDPNNAFLGFNELPTQQSTQQEATTTQTQALADILRDEIVQLRDALKRHEDNDKTLASEIAALRGALKQELRPLQDVPHNDDSAKRPGKEGAAATDFGVKEDTSLASHLVIANELKERREKYGFNATMCEAPERRRRKVHWCHHWHHMGRPMSILQDEYCIDHMVDAAQTNDWDIVFGGYPHCGKRGANKDWDMKSGLNKHLKEKGWENLQWHQVWFPCMGCSQSYCNKRDLCPLLKTIDPSLCYELPGDLPLLQEDMKHPATGNSTGLWVLKQDSSSINFYSGRGIHFIKEPSQLPSASEMAGGTYLVQKFIDQWMGQGKFYRRHEIRMYLAVTSTSPLRAYAFEELWGSFAHMRFNPHADVSEELCMLDTHARKKICERTKMDIPLKERSSIRFETLVKQIDLPPLLQEKFLLTAKTMLAKIILGSQPTVNASPVNQGITKSGASCFSFMRADMSITSDGTAALYEINEFPFVGSDSNATASIITKAYRDLFKMIGMGVAPMKANQRKEYELAHLGGWEPLIIDGEHA